MESYDVTVNIADDERLVVDADYIIAFCGHKMYTPKNRTGASNNPPRKPDLVVGYYTVPEPHIKVLGLRSGQ